MRCDECLVMYSIVHICSMNWSINAYNESSVGYIYMYATAVRVA